MSFHSGRVGATTVSWHADHSNLVYIIEDALTRFQDLRQPAQDPQQSYSESAVHVPQRCRSHGDRIWLTTQPHNSPK